MKKNLRSIIITLLLLAGLAAAVYLVQTQKIFKSRANVDQLRVTTSDGAQVQKENNQFTTISDTIRIEVPDISP